MVSEAMTSKGSTEVSFLGGGGEALVQCKAVALWP
jgi:hypothetical protein